MATNYLKRTASMKHQRSSGSFHCEEICCCICEKNQVYCLCTFYFKNVIVKTGGFCKHVTALLCQVSEWQEFDLKIVPAKKLSFSKKNISVEAKNIEAAVFSDLVFEKVCAEKDQSHCVWPFWDMH